MHNDISEAKVFFLSQEKFLKSDNYKSRQTLNIFSR